MTFIAPAFLVAGVGVATAMVLLHFLARRRPRPAVLPTARFVPDRPARWPSRAPRPTDWLLLVVRVMATLAIAAAFAGPMRRSDRAITSRVVVVDQSRAVADDGSVRESALAMLREGDLLVVFDTLVRVIANGARDTVAALERSAAPASLSAALIAAERAALTIRDRADSVELVIVGPFAAESWDEATPALRARWRGRARLITVPLAAGDSSARTIVVQAPRSDPVRAAAAPWASEAEGRVRLTRAVPTASDSAWARTQGSVLVSWPRAAERDSMRAEGIAGAHVALVAPVVRRPLDAAGARVLARFADGSPAIVERALGSGCVRDVAFDLPAIGDVALRESVRRIVHLVAAPCAGAEPRHAMGMSRMDSLRGPAALLATSALPRPAEARSAATSWLLVAAALLLMLEIGLRRRVQSV